jgi:hypothetical protein
MLSSADSGAILYLNIYIWSHNVDYVQTGREAAIHLNNNNNNNNNKLDLPSQKSHMIQLLTHTTTQSKSLSKY